MLFINCPHCHITIEIEQVNCGIFRCGIMISDGKQIDPHLSKEKCDFLAENDLIYGCGKPFRLLGDQAFICDYI